MYTYAHNKQCTCTCILHVHIYFICVIVSLFQVPPPGRSYPPPHPPSAASPMTAPVHPGVLPPPEQVVGRLIVRGKFEFRSVSSHCIMYMYMYVCALMCIMLNGGFMMICND